MSIERPLRSAFFSFSMLFFLLSPLDRSTMMAADWAIQPKTGILFNSFLASGLNSPGMIKQIPGISRNDVWLLT
jgi:hypothetical protein